ncbi:MAG: hypothetical protein ACJAU0_000658 [Flavobacteriales bacterium]|jgi:hypothetical protein
MIFPQIGFTTPKEPNNSRFRLFFFSTYVLREANH